MQFLFLFFFSGIVLTLTRTQEKKFEDIFLVRIANKGTLIGIPCIPQ